MRGTFPGLTYQLGNLLSAFAAQWEAAYATKLPAARAGGRELRPAMAIVMVIVFAAVFVLTAIGRERRGVSFDETTAEEA